MVRVEKKQHETVAMEVDVETAKILSEYLSHANARKAGERDMPPKDLLSLYLFWDKLDDVVGDNFSPWGACNG
jgi:hypothetical protein